MRSKEALERLLMLARPCDYEVREHRNNYCDMLENVIKKDLYQLEEYRKIEDELELDLITLFKVLKQRFVYDKDQVKIELLGLHIKSDELYLYGFVENTMHAVYLRLKDYGKTWTMTKEEFYKNIK